MFVWKVRLVSIIPTFYISKLSMFATAVSPLKTAHRAGFLLVTLNYMGKPKNIKSKVTKINSNNRPTFGGLWSQNCLIEDISYGGHVLQDNILMGGYVL